MVFRDEDPLSATNFRDPLYVWRVLGEMIDMHFDVRAGSSKCVGYNETADLIIEEKCERSKSRSGAICVHAARRSHRIAFSIASGGTA